MINLGWREPLLPSARVRRMGLRCRSFSHSQDPRSLGSGPVDLTGNAHITRVVSAGAHTSVVGIDESAPRVVSCCMANRGESVESVERANPL